MAFYRTQLQQSVHEPEGNISSTEFLWVGLSEPKDDRINPRASRNPRALKQISDLSSVSMVE